MPSDIIRLWLCAMNTFPSSTDIIMHEYSPCKIKFVEIDCFNMNSTFSTEKIPIVSNMVFWKLILPYPKPLQNFLGPRGLMMRIASADSCSFLPFSIFLSFFLSSAIFLFTLIWNEFIKFRPWAAAGMCEVFSGVHGCVGVCVLECELGYTALHRYARVCTGVSRCAWVCTGVCGYAQVPARVRWAGVHGCVHVCGPMSPRTFRLFFYCFESFCLCLPNLSNLKLNSSSLGH